MSELEKKAIVRAREHLTNPACNYLSDEEIEILLDLIDKQEERLVKFQEHIDNQQKEIEELKEITKEYNSYIGEKMPLDSKIIIADREYFINGTFVNKFVSKDKIRKEIAKTEEELYNGEMLQRFAYIKIETLKELLEEE